MSWWNRVLGRKADLPIRFDTTFWKSVSGGGDGLKWRDSLDNELHVCFHMQPAEHLLEASDIGSLRAYWRRRAESCGGGAIVSVESVGIAGIRGEMAIVKYKSGLGNEYVGTITIPLADSHVTIVMSASEHGATGAREAAVSAVLASRGELDLSGLAPGESAEGPIPIPGWVQDPYDPGYEGRVLCALSDDARFDAFCPDHPLSRIRSAFADILQSVALDPSLPVTAGPRFQNDDAVWTAPAASRISAETVSSLYWIAERYDEVEKVLTESLRQRDGSADADQNAVAKESLLVGFACERQGKFPTAESAFRRASAIFEGALGENHLDTAEALSGLARALLAQRKHEEAEPLFHRSLQVFETAAGGSMAAGVALNGLGLVYDARKLYPEAIAYHERALAIFELVCGFSSPVVVAVLRHLALAFEKLGNMERRAEAFERIDRIEREQGSS